jgi:hypothetical protein
MGVNNSGLPRKVDPFKALPNWFASRCGKAWLTYMHEDPCVYCGGAADSAEHITPMSKGGENHWGNLARACRGCNSSRSSHPFILWMMIRDAARAARRGLPPTIVIPAAVMRLRVVDEEREKARRMWGYPKRVPGKDWATKVRHAGRRY